MNTFLKWLKVCFRSLEVAIKVAAVAVIIAAMVVFAQSPVFWGIVLITTGAILAVKVIGLVSFAVGFLASFFSIAKKEEPITEQVNMEGVWKEVMSFMQKKGSKEDVVTGKATLTPDGAN